MRQTRFRLRLGVERIDRRMSLVLLAAILVVFAFAFAIGRLTSDTTASTSGEATPGQHGSLAVVAIPAGLSAAPAIAALLPVKAPRKASAAVLTPSLVPAVTIHPPSAGLTSPVPVHRPTVIVPSISPAPSHAGGVPSAGAAPPAQSPTDTGSPSGAGAGGGGSSSRSFDSSG